MSTDETDKFFSWSQHVEIGQIQNGLSTIEMVRDLSPDIVAMNNLNIDNIAQLTEDAIQEGLTLPDL